MTLKSEIRQIAKIAWPLLMAQLAQTLMGVSDTIMAGRVSAQEMAGVAIAASIMFPCMIFLQGIIMALPPIISRLHGAKQDELIPKAGQQGFWLALILSVPFFVLSFFTEPLVAPIPMDDALRVIVAEYLQYIFAGFPAFLFYQVLRQYCEGLSMTKPTMLIMFLGLLVNIPANYIFINGKFGAPVMGGAGCGLATALVFCCMFIATYFYTKYAAKLKPFPLFGEFQAPSKQGMHEILKLGIPIAFALLFEVTLFSLVSILLARFGADVVAAHQIALNISSVLFMLPLSVGLASTIRIGFVLGLQHSDDDEQAFDTNSDTNSKFMHRASHSLHAKSAVNAAMLLGMGLASINALICILFQNQLPGLYTTEVEVLQRASELMLLGALFQFSDSAQIIAGCALRGYKDAKATFYLSFVAYWGIGLSCGIILGMTDWFVPAMAAKGFWIGFIVGLTAAAFLLSLRLKWIQGQIGDHNVAV